MATRIFSVAEHSFENVQGVAVAITAIDDHQRHVGILHRDGSTGQVMLLHLAWHLALSNTTPKNRYVCVDPPIPLARGRQVAAVCRKIFRANKEKIPYAFSSPNDCFDYDTGAYLFGPKHHGLTCATLVLAVFLTAGVQLIFHETWPDSRPGDELWKRNVIKALQNPKHTLPPATEEHIAALESESKTIRFRPEDVAGAAATEAIPATFEQAAIQANAILQKLRSML